MTNLDKLINNPLFTWAPTLLFLLLVGLGFLVGVLRGLHKTKVYFKQTIVLFIILFALYFFLVNTKLGDQVLLFIVDNIFMMLYGNTVSGYYGIGECSGTKELILNLLPMFLPENDYFSLLLFNPGYILTIVDLVFHIAFALVFYVLYLILKLIINIIWFIFHSEKRYRLKIDNKFSLGKVDRPYQKRRLTAGLVSGFRSFLSCLLLFSILGTVFFMIAATNNHEELENTEMPTGEIQTVVKVYKGLEKMGSEGIFKVLNSIKDNHDTPYYLLLCDVVFQGKLEDSINDVNKTIYFREEIGTYTNLAKNLYNLVMKYRASEIMASLSGESEDLVQDILVDLFSDETFQKEFKTIITEFDSKTFFVNLVVSLLDSMINTDDSILYQSLPVEVTEIFKILFKQNYLSPLIPDEANLIEINKTRPVGDEIYLPSLKISKFLEQRDLEVIYDIVNEFMANPDLFTPSTDEESTSDDTELKLSKRSDEVPSDEYSDATDALGIDIESIISTVDVVIKKVSQLSIFQGDKRSELSPVLGRIYAFAVTNFLQYEGEQYAISSDYYGFINYEVNWVNEVENLVVVAKDLISIVNSLMTSSDIFTTLTQDFFNPSHPNYNSNLSSFNTLLNSIKTSKLLASILSQSVIMEIITTSISQISPNMTIPDDMLLENTVVNGKMQYNEMYCMLNALRILALPENQDIIVGLTSGELTTQSMISLFTSLSSEDSSGKTQIEYILDSKVLESLISSFIIDFTENGSIPLYIPDTSRKINNSGEVTNIIKKEELLFVVNNISTIFDIVSPILYGEEVNLSSILAQLSNGEVLHLLTNDIIAGTISTVLIDFLKQTDIVMLPKHLENIEFWIHPQSGELMKLLSCLTNNSIDIELLLNNSGDSSDLLVMLASITQSDIDLLLSSDVLHYTISNVLLSLSGEEFNGLELIIPNSSKQMLYQDVMTSLIYKDELKGLLSNIGLFSDFNDTNKLLINIITNRNSLTNNKIILASSVNLLVNSPQTSIESLSGDAIKIPTELKKQATREKLQELSLSNPWNHELQSLFTAVEELIDINSSTLDFEGLQTDLVKELPSFNEMSETTKGLTKLEVITKSSIMLYSISSYIDVVFEALVSPSDLEMAKTQQGTYRHEELEAIVNTINIFGINLEEPNMEAVQDKIMGDFVNFAKPKKEYDGKSVIEMVYDSVVVKTLIRDTIDVTVKSMVDNIAKLDNCKDGYGCYKKEEIINFINGISILGIDLEDPQGLEEKIFVLSYEQIISAYASHIIRYTISDNLTKFLESQKIINKQVLHSSKVMHTEVNVYPYIKSEEIKNLKQSLNELGIASEESLSTYFTNHGIDDLSSPSTTDSSKMKIEVVSESYIIRGIISDNILSNEETSKYHHDLAFETNCDVYKQSEILVLLDIKKKTNTSDYSLDEIKSYIYDNYGRTKSYLFVKFISDSLLNNKNITVPLSSLDNRCKTDCISPQEIARLIDGIKALGNKDITSINIKFPETDDEIDKICKSSILKATISQMIKFDNETVMCYQTNCTIDKSYDGKNIIMLTEEEFKGFVSAISLLASDSADKFNASFSITSVMTLSDTNKETIFKSSIITHIVTKQIKESFGGNKKVSAYVSLHQTSKVFYKIDDSSKTYKESTLTAVELKAFFNNLTSLMYS